MKTSLILFYPGIVTVNATDKIAVQLPQKNILIFGKYCHSTLHQ
jgi:hypothetical protein